MLKKNWWTPFLKAWPFFFSLGLHAFLIFMLVDFFIKIPPQSVESDSLRVHMVDYHIPFLPSAFVEAPSQPFSEPVDPPDFAEPVLLPVEKNKAQSIKKIKKPFSKKENDQKTSAIKKQASSDLQPDPFIKLMKKKEGDSGQMRSPSTGTNREPNAFKKVKPVYPARALALGIEGKVKVQYDIDAQGRVHNIRLLESDPPNIFERSVKKAMRQWAFEAHPFKDRVTVIVFKLENGVARVE